MPLSPRFNLHRRGRAFRIRRRDVRSGRRAPWQPPRPSKLIPIGTLPLIRGVVVSYSYPGSDKRKSKRKVPASGRGRGTTYIAVGDYVRGNFREIYLLASSAWLCAETGTALHQVVWNRFTPPAGELWSSFTSVHCAMPDDPGCRSPQTRNDRCPGDDLVSDGFGSQCRAEVKVSCVRGRSEPSRTPSFYHLLVENVVGMDELPKR
jgi:hypothetical protein